MNASSHHIRADGMMSVLNHVASDRQRYGSIDGAAGLYNPDIIYATDGIAARIIDRPAEDSLSKGFSIVGDEKQDILNEFDRLNAFTHIVDAVRWTRLHGGAAILVFVDDGLDITEPLNLSKIRLIEDLITYPASSITAGAGRYSDPTKRNYGYPNLYNLQPTFGTSFYVHESRLVFMSGDPLPGSLRQQHGLPWIGRSALDSSYTALCRYHKGLKLSEGILERKVQLVHKMSNLGGMLAAGDDDIVAKRLAMADSVRGIFNMLAVDALDDVVLADTQLGGIGEVLSDYKLALSASCGVPQAILFGDKQGGLNSNAEGELSIYHDTVQSIQKRQVSVAIERLAGVIWSQKALPSSEPQKWQIQFNPLFSPQPKEIAEVEQIKANSRKSGMDAVTALQATLVVTPEEVRAASALVFPELNLQNSDVPLMPDDVPDDGPVGQTVGVNSSGAVRGL